jgi:hypothetical protein
MRRELSAACLSAALASQVPVAARHSMRAEFNETPPLGLSCWTRREVNERREERAEETRRQAGRQAALHVRVVGRPVLAVAGGLQQHLLLHTCDLRVQATALVVLLARDREGFPRELDGDLAVVVDAQRGLRRERDEGGLQGQARGAQRHIHLLPRTRELDEAAQLLGALHQVLAGPLGVKKTSTIWCPPGSQSCRPSSR